MQAEVILILHQSVLKVCSRMYRNGRAAHPEHQSKICEEISQGHPQGVKLTSVEYDSMQFLNATIQEVLRLHPIAHTLMRRAVQDDCLPLCEPIISKDGNILKEIPIAKEQTLLCSIYTYNWLPRIWSSDADQWNPNRFINNRTKPQTPACQFTVIWLRNTFMHLFAIMEIQVILVDLLKAFRVQFTGGSHYTRIFRWARGCPCSGGQSYEGLSGSVALLRFGMMYFAT